jgi:transcriptional regulator with XRE-family HTH domain
MSDFNLKKWRQRSGLTKDLAADKLGLDPYQYYAYENNNEEIPEYILLAAFAIDITEALWERAVEQNPELKELRQSYSFARSHFIDTLILENKLLFSIQLDKSKPLLSSKGDKR